MTLAAVASVDLLLADIGTAVAVGVGAVAVQDAGSDDDAKADYAAAVDADVGSPGQRDGIGCGHSYLF